MVDTAHKKTQASAGPLAVDELELLDAYWRAANYVSVGQIYLLANPLLREPLRAEHVKPRLLGHWGTTPGLNLVYAHVNRAIRARDLDVIYIAGPGHGGPGMVANAYLEGTYSRSIRTCPGTRRACDALPPVLVPGRHSEPRGARNAGFDPRGRRARLFARSCIRGGDGQPGPRCGLRRRRRRGGDRSPRHELALQQVPQPAQRRRRAAGPPPERLQDRQSHRARPHPRGGARRAFPRIRIRAAPRHRRVRRRTFPAGAPALRVRPRRGPRRDPGDSARSARAGRSARTGAGP